MPQPGPKRMACHFERLVGTARTMILSISTGEPTPSLISGAATAGGEQWTNWWMPSLSPKSNTAQPNESGGWHGPRLRGHANRMGHCTRIEPPILHRHHIALIRRGSSGRQPGATCGRVACPSRRRGHVWSSSHMPAPRSAMPRRLRDHTALGDVPINRVGGLDTWDRTC